MNISLAEKMMGHSVTVILDNVYLDPTIDQLFNEFKKAIHELTINSEKRQQFEIKKKEGEIITLKIAQKEKIEQDEKIKSLTERLDTLSTSQFAMVSTIQEMVKTDEKTMKKFISIFEKDFKNITDLENS